MTTRSPLRTFRDVQGLEAVGKAADQRVELTVGDDALRTIFAEPDVGDAVTALRVGMAVERVERDIGLSPDKPLVVNAVPTEDF
jgi:hypothetical protein